MEAVRASAALALMLPRKRARRSAAMPPLPPPPPPQAGEDVPPAPVESEEGMK